MRDLRRRPARFIEMTALAATALVASVVLTACAGDGSSAPSAMSATPTPAVVAFPMPDIGPEPEPDPPLTDAESEAKRLENVESEWQHVLATYPDAVRPDVAFEGYVTAETRVEVIRACYEASGVPVDLGYDNADLSGEPVSVGFSTTNAEQRVAAYACDVAHPTKVTTRGPNAAQLGWIYEYLTRFLAPCYAANGYDNPPAPSKEDFVANWPNQAWFPTAGATAPLDDEHLTAVLEACPGPDER